MQVQPFRNVIVLTLILISTVKSQSAHPARNTGLIVGFSFNISQYPQFVHEKDFLLQQTVSQDNIFRTNDLIMIFSPDELQRFKEIGITLGYDPHRFTVSYSGNELNYFGNYLVRTFAIIRDQGIKKKATVDRINLDYRFQAPVYDIVDFYTGLSYSQINIRINSTLIDYYYEPADLNFLDQLDGYREQTSQLGILIGTEVYFQNILSMNVDIGFMKSIQHTELLERYYQRYRIGFNIYIL